MTAATEAGRRTVLVALTVASVVLLAALYLTAVHTRFGQRVDDAALRGRIGDSAVQHAVQRALGTVSVTSLVIATVALGILALIRRRPVLAIGVGVLVIGANVTTQLMKESLTRPDLLSDAIRVTSFPSGHATVAMSLVLALVVAVPARLRLRIGAPGVAYAAIVGAATLTGAWHRASDVVGAYLVALAWAGAVSAWLVTPRPARAATTVPARAVDRLVAAVTVLVVVAAVVMGIDVLREARVDEIEVSRAYLAGIAAIGAGAVLTLAALLLGLGGAELDASAPA